MRIVFRRVHAVMGLQLHCRENHDLRIRVLADHELRRVLQIPDALLDESGIVTDQVAGLAELESETHPGEELAETERLARRIFRFSGPFEGGTPAPRTLAAHRSSLEASELAVSFPAARR